MISEKVFRDGLFNESELNNMADKAEVKNMLDDVLNKYREKAEEDERITEKLKDFERKISIRFEDDGNYHFTISKGEVGDIKEGALSKSEITIDTDTVTMKALIEGKIGVMEAYARKRIKVDASFLDMLKIKDMF